VNKFIMKVKKAEEELKQTRGKTKETRKRKASSPSWGESKPSKATMMVR
jgi:hypothetical protein